MTTIIALLCAGLAFPALTHAASVTLAWDYVPHPDRPATGFVLERCTGVACTDFVPLAPLPLAPTTYTDGTVEPTWTYRWRLRATDASGDVSPPSNTTQEVVPLPRLPKPNNLTSAPVRE